MIQYGEFLERLCRRSLEAAQESYKNDPPKLAGARNAYAAMRGKSAEELAGMLAAAKSRTYSERLKAQGVYWSLPEGPSTCRFWIARETEIEWICNCLGAVLAGQNVPSPFAYLVTARGYINASKIVDELMRERSGAR